MRQYIVEYCAFAYDTFNLKGESVITTQRHFRTHFNIGRLEAIPSYNTISRWINNLITDSVMKKVTRLQET